MCVRVCVGVATSHDGLRYSLRRVPTQLCKDYFEENTVNLLLRAHSRRVQPWFDVYHMLSQCMDEMWCAAKPQMGHKTL